MNRIWKIATVTLSLLLAPSAQVAAQPTLVGEWQTLPSWPFAASHAALLPDGRVLLWNDLGDAPQIWNPVSNSFSSAQHPSAPLAGTSPVQLASGGVGVLGGRDASGLGATTTWRFDPGSVDWIPMAPLQQARNEPGAFLMGDARLFVVGGDQQTGIPADLPETALPDDPWQTVLAASLVLPRHPWAFLRPGGLIVVAGPDVTTRLLDEDQQTWSVVDDMILGSRPAGSAVLVPGEPDEILIAGGRDAATATCERIDLAGGGGWMPTGPMSFGRRHHNLTLLANGDVLATGGTMTGDELAYSVLQAEAYDPDIGTWTTWAPMSVSRRAHSVALLLPDARVLVAGGGDGSAGSELHADASLFSPPFLFQGPRPSIRAAPDSIRYQSIFTVGSPEAPNIEEVWFVRAGAVTGGFNSDQRALSLSFTAVPQELTVAAPDSAGQAPPGTWMLFLVDDAGIPSEAALVRMQDGPPVVPLPSITTSPPTTGEVGVNYVYQGQASGGAPISWSLSQAPVWMGVNSFNGIVTGVPTQEGTVDVTLRATNVEGYDEQSWQIEVDPENMQPETVVPLGATWRYFKGEQDPGSDWATLAYDDSGWLQGISGFGFGDNDDATVLNDMRYNYSTLFTRITFPLQSAATATRVSVLFDYDDGFAAFLNGTRITSRQAPSSIGYQDVATGSQEATGVFERDDFTDPGTLALLQDGSNVLAVVGLNRSIWSGDFTLKIELEVAGGGGAPVDVGDGLERLPVRVRPNPFHAGTQVSFAMRRAGTARLEVYDVSGRRVFVVQRHLPLGPQALTWDGRDQQGRPTAAGIYPYRLVAPSVDVVGKMTRLSPTSR
jgi:hypothetical protein